MKSLIPSHRENKRYLLVRGAVKDIETSILEFIGVSGMSRVGLVWIKKAKDSAVIGVNREMLDAVRASFAVSQNKIEVAKVSGTLKSLDAK